MICVIGGTGTVGSALVSQLVKRDLPARVVTRSAAGRAVVERAGSEAAEGDLDRPESLDSAMAGCDRLFLLSPPHPAQVTRETAAIDTARRAGVRHVVAVSIKGADSAASINFARWHAAIDHHLIESGLGYTILRPAGFMRAHLWPVQSVKTHQRWYGMTGDGVAGFIDAEDVAAVAAQVLSAPGHEGATYELTGPAAISMPEAAQTLSEVTGSPVEYVDLPAVEFRAHLSAAGTPPFIADGVTGLYRTIRAGHAATVTNTVEQVSGRPARTYRQFAERNHRKVAQPESNRGPAVTSGRVVYGSW